MNELLIEAKNEIKQLRRQLEIEVAKTQTMEIFAVALGMRPMQPSQTVDIVWKIEKFINQNTDAS